jgi:hypothetical protein
MLGASEAYEEIVKPATWEYRKSALPSSVPLETFRGNHSCAARRLANTPFFLEATRCLAGILGESQDSRLNPGLDRKAKLAIISAKPERFEGESLEGVLESRSGLIMGDFVSGRISRHEGRGAGKSTTPKASARLKNPPKGSHIS